MHKMYSFALYNVSTSFPILIRANACVHICILVVTIIILVKKSFVLQDGRTPLGFAAGFGHVDCVNVLLDRDANIDHQSKVSRPTSFTVHCVNFLTLMFCMDSTAKLYAHMVIVSMP